MHLPGRPATVCLLRALTGIPCPACGGTTAAVDVGHGHLLAALRASPLAVLGSAALVLAPLLRWRLRVSPWAVVVPVAVASELWQLARFGLL